MPMHYRTPSLPSLLIDIRLRSVKKEKRTVLQLMMMTTKAAAAATTTKSGNSDNNKKKISSLSADSSSTTTTSYNYYIRLFNMMIIGFVRFAGGVVLGKQLTSFDKRGGSDESNKGTGSGSVTATATATTTTISATKMSRSLLLFTPPANCDVMEVYVQNIPGPEGDGDGYIKAENAIGDTALSDIFLPPTASNPNEVGDKIGLFFKTLTNTIPNFDRVDECPSTYENNMFLFDPEFDASVGGGITRYL
jgi:hypothetical protein